LKQEIEEITLAFPMKNGILTIAQAEDVKHSTSKRASRFIIFNGGGDSGDFGRISKKELQTTSCHLKSQPPEQDHAEDEHKVWFSLSFRLLQCEFLQKPIVWTYEKVSNHFKRLISL
jgi:hypothetical protein